MKRLCSSVSILFLILFVQPQLKARTNSAEEVRAAYGVIARVLPSHQKDFHLQLIENSDSTDAFEVEASHGSVTVRGNSAISLTRGVYYYLRNAAHCQFSWEGEHMDLPKVLPDFKRVRIESPYKYRLYYNLCTFGYTTAFWDWKQWQREIDWMALHGINMPLAMVG